ncbi:unnamed protein product, partial [Ascophyllum nodosum]
STLVYLPVNFVPGRLSTSSVSPSDAAPLTIRYLYHLSKTLSPSLSRGCILIIGSSASWRERLASILLTCAVAHSAKIPGKSSFYSVTFKFLVTFGKSPREDRKKHICGRTSRGQTGGRSQRISPPSFCGACLNFSWRTGG